MWRHREPVVSRLCCPRSAVEGTARGACKSWKVRTRRPNVLLMSGGGRRFVCAVMMAWPGGSGFASMASVAGFSDSTPSFGTSDMPDNSSTHSSPAICPRCGAPSNHCVCGRPACQHMTWKQTPYGKECADCGMPERVYVNLQPPGGFSDIHPAPHHVDAAHEYPRN